MVERAKGVAAGRGRGRARAEVCDHGWRGVERDEPHGSSARGARERIDREDLLQARRAPALRLNGGWLGLMPHPPKAFGTPGRLNDDALRARLAPWRSRYS